MATIVTPGTVVGSAENKSLGQGTAEENGNLIALLTGVVSESDGVVSVRTYNEMLRVQVGDTVIGEVVKLNEKSGEIKILSVEGKPNRSVMADQEYAQFHVTKSLTDSFTTQPMDCAAEMSCVPRSLKQAM